MSTLFICQCCGTNLAICSECISDGIAHFCNECNLTCLDRDFSSGDPCPNSIGEEEFD